MQKEMTILENEPFRFKIHAEWDSESATYFTRELYRYAEKGRISFELNTRKGSLLTDFLVSILANVVTDVFYNLIKKIYKIVRKQKQKGKVIKPVHIFTEKEEFIITGEKDSRIPEELKRELDEE